MGVLIYKGVVPFDAMKDLVGGAAIKIWGVAEKWTLETRESQGHDLIFEWFQWLVDRLHERSEGNRVPAFLAYKDWQEQPDVLMVTGTFFSCWPVSEMRPFSAWCCDFLP